MWEVKKRHISEIAPTFLAYMIKNLVTLVTEIENMEKGMLPKFVLTLKRK